ncbi:hypothetical protein [Mesonia sp.]|uniref:hypothetical protein n=1 Tax=Mesonia sp. TaxID=1960830 RepID=UPI00176B4712|nr:hypothetical protein [Mesonia sp.]HIB37991.1 hypothetical protein [Mesonia sp.]
MQRILIEWDLKQAKIIKVSLVDDIIRMGGNYEKACTTITQAKLIAAALGYSIQPIIDFENTL